MVLFASEKSDVKNKISHKNKRAPCSFFILYNYYGHATSKHMDKIMHANNHCIPNYFI